MKLDWKLTFLIGFGFLGISVMWQVYNLFVPLFLQAGNPDFDSQTAAKTHIVQEGETFESIAELYNMETSELRELNRAAATSLEVGNELSIQPYTGFGLSASLAGTIMTLDNIAALFILPVIGVWSDRTRTRLGRRFPYILAGAPVAAISFALIPVAAGLISPGTNGSIAQNQEAFAFFMIAAGLMLLAMALFRTPVIALMPDLTPSPLRSKANGVINFMGGIGGIIAALGLSILFDQNPLYPFIAGSVILIVAIALLFFTVKEPDVSEIPHPESDEEEALGALKGVKLIPPAYRRSLLFLMLAIFSWFVGFNGIETFFSSYAVTTLGVTAGEAGPLFSVALGLFILFAVPAGFIGERFGRKRTIMVGLVAFAILLTLAFFFANVTLIIVVLALGGASWALVNINSLPMVVDTTEDERLLGTYTGLYYFASQSAAIFGPILNGVIIDLTGRNYNSIFLVTPAFFALAVLCMLFVTRGEAHVQTAVEG